MSLRGMGVAEPPVERLAPRPLFTGMYTGDGLQAPVGPAAASRVEAREDDGKIALADLTVGQSLNGTVQGSARGRGVYVDVGAQHLGFLHSSEYCDGFPTDAVSLKKGDEVTVRVLTKEGSELQLTRRSGGLERPVFNPAWLTASVKPMKHMPPSVVFSGEVVDMSFSAVTVRFSPKKLLEAVQVASGQGKVSSAEISVALQEVSGDLFGKVSDHEFSPGFKDSAALGDTVQVRLKSINIKKNSLQLSMRNVAGRQASEMKVGETLHGVVLGMHDRDAFVVDVGAFYDAILPVWECRDGFPERFDPSLARGSNVTVRVLSVDGDAVYVTRRTGDITRPSSREPLTFDGDATECISEGSDAVLEGTVVNMSMSGILLKVEAPSGGYVSGFVHRDDFYPAFLDEARIGLRVSAIPRYVNEERNSLIMRLVNSNAMVTEEPKHGDSRPEAGVTEVGVEQIGTEPPPGMQVDATGPQSQPQKVTQKRADGANNDLRQLLLEL